MNEGSEESTDPGEQAAKPRKRTQGVVSIDTERCKGCCYCVEFCPMHVLIMSSKFNAKGHHYPEVDPDGKCTACDLCGMFCPDFAIHAQRVSKPDSTKE
ncbi:MAG: 4Fe-4S binding protein [Phycisphaerales bacterium]|nr:MAG: 4Fe-4S binding protein [Phycisphaerales bacterium]